MNFSIKNNLMVKDLVTEFAEVEFNQLETANGFMVCLVAKFKNEKDVIQNWDSIQSMAVALLKPENRHARWNLYFAIFCPTKLTIAEKYFIQNDKFAMRKVVFDDMKKTPNDAEILNEINTSILGSDLNITQYPMKLLMKPTFNLKKYLQNIPTDSGTESKARRKEAIAQIINHRIIEK